MLLLQSTYCLFIGGDEFSSLITIKIMLLHPSQHVVHRARQILGKKIAAPPIDTATAFTELAPCHLSCSLANAIRVACCARHAKTRWTQPKYCACHTKRLSTRFETCCNVTKYEVPRQTRKTTLGPASTPWRRKGFAI